MSLTYHSVGYPTGQPAGVTIGAEANVDIYQNYYSGVAREAMENLEFQMDQLADLDWSPTGFSAEPGTVTPFGLVFTPPAGIPEWDFTLDMPIYAVPDPILKVIDFEVDATKPDPFTDEALPIDTPTKPEALDAELTATAPLVNDVIIPDVPEMGDIPEPLIKAVEIPSLTPLVYPEFNEIKPTSAHLTAPDTEFAWSEEDYDSAILQSTQSRISEFLAGGVGIPDYVWDAIWARGRDKQRREGEKLVTEITEEFASKGFDLPQGAQVARIDEALKASHDKISELNRELVIQQAQHEIENLKYAIAQGQALENMIGGWYQGQMARALEAAKYSIQASIEVFNAQLSLFNAEVQMYSIAAQVYKVQLEAELSKLEEHRILLEAAKLTNDINLQEVQIYSARIDAYATEVAAYESHVKAIATTIEVDKTKMEAYKIEVQAYAELVRAKSVEFDGYKAQWDGELAKVNVFEAQVKAYDSQVNAYRTEVEAEGIEKTTQLKINDEQFKKFSSALEGHNAKTKTEISRLESTSTEFDADLKSYGQLVDNSKNVLTTQIKDYELAISHSSQQTQASITTAQNLTAASTASNELNKTTAEIMARAYSQLAASAMSVVSVSAGISDGTSNSSGQSLSYDGGNV